jgi:TonB family protein
MTRLITAAFVGAMLGLLPAAAAADDVRGAIVACVRIDDSGAVTDAFVLKSSGDPTIDAGMLAVIKKHDWGKKQLGETGPGETRNAWHPQRMTMKGAAPYDLPPSCAPQPQ